MRVSEPAFWTRFKQRPEREQQTYIRIFTFLVVVVAWEITGQVLGNIFLAPISDVAIKYYALAVEEQMFQTLLYTLQDMIVAFLLAVVTMVPLGLLMGRSRTIEQALNPWVSAFYVTATASLLPVFIIVFGIDFAFRVSITYVSCMFFILLNCYHGAVGVDIEYIQTGRSFGVSRFKAFKDIVFPATLPYIYAGLRMGLIHAIRGIILAETFIAYGYGGFIANYAHQTADTAPVLALILTIMILGYAARVGLEKLQWYLFPWSDTSDVVG